MVAQGQEQEGWGVSAKGQEDGENVLILTM